MFSALFVASLLAFTGRVVVAAPATNLIETRSGVTTVSAATISDLSIYAQVASPAIILDAFYVECINSFLVRLTARQQKSRAGPAEVSATNGVLRAGYLTAMNRGL